jgi:glycosyltransferase involved in cell wall biosynthesis
VIHSAIRHSPFAGDIHCKGFIPDSDLPTWYRAADVFVYPSLFEGFGLPPVEAMACGCPVISSTRGALAEITGMASATVDPEDVHSMQLQMTRLATNPNLCEYLRTAGLERANYFDWNRNAAATMEVYQRVAVQTSA